jgi:hypothetical protein
MVGPRTPSAIGLCAAERSLSDSRALSSTTESTLGLLIVSEALSLSRNDSTRAASNRASDLRNFSTEGCGFFSGMAFGEFFDPGYVLFGCSF